MHSSLAHVWPYTMCLDRILDSHLKPGYVTLAFTIIIYIPKTQNQ